MSLLEARKLNISFSGIQILFDVDFEINAGEINCLCGGNGAGKSTLVKILSGINSNYSGEILIDGEPVRITSPQEAIKHGIYAVQQHRDLVPTLNAVENMFLCNEICKGNGRQRFDFAAMKKKSMEYIEKFGQKINLDVPVSQLKVSEQGIIAICKALVANSKILLIDEASAPLDDSERVALYSFLQMLAKEGKGIVYITHHLDEVFRIGHTVTVLRDGRTIAKNFIDELDKQKLISLMTGSAKLYARDFSKVEDKYGEKVLEIKDLSANGLEDINLYIREGEILGIAGLEASGKKELAEVCFGIRKFSNGTVNVRGNIVTPKFPIDAIRKNMGLVPDDRKEAGLVLTRNIADNITITFINKYRKLFSFSGWSKKIADDFMLLTS